MAKSVACQDQWFAIGLSDGLVYVYHSHTCEESMSIIHGESVRLLQFSPVAKLLASAGLQSVRLWDTTSGKRLLDFALTTEPLALAFDQTHIVVSLSFTSYY